MRKNSKSLFWARKKPLRARGHTHPIFDAQEILKSAIFCGETTRVGKASDWEAEGSRFNSRCAQTQTGWAGHLEIWILPHPETDDFAGFGDGKCDNCPGVEQIWGDIEKCLYYHPMPEQIMWVQPPKTLLFVEIEGFRKMSSGGQQLRFSKMSGSIFPGRGSPD